MRTSNQKYKGFNLIIFLSLTAFAGLAATSGCSSSDTQTSAQSTSSGSGGSGGSVSSAGGGGADSGFAITKCGQCAETQCESYISACNSDPQCPDYLSCFLACPQDPKTSNVDTSCVAKCPSGSTSESEKAEADVLVCITKGAGAKNCAACGNAPIVTAGPQPETCKKSTEPMACDVCRDESCCKEWDVCTTPGSACATFDDCWETCTGNGGMDGECLAQCAKGNQTGLDQMSAFFSCNVYWCEACHGTEDPCRTCQGTECNAEYSNLYQDPLGFELNFCFSDCLTNHQGDVDQCKAKCFTGHPTEEKLFDAYEECLLIGCSDACGMH